MRFSWNHRARFVLAAILALVLSQLSACSSWCSENFSERQKDSASCKEPVLENETNSSGDNASSEQPDLHELPYKYFGNNFSQKFHRPSCPYGRVISASHLVPFHFRREAVVAGFKPCRYCLPQAWGSVRCFILPPQKEAPEVKPEPQPEPRKSSQNKIDNSAIRLDGDRKSL